MRYLDKSFSVGGHTQTYATGWDRVFGKPDAEADIPQLGPDQMHESVCAKCDSALLLVGRAPEPDETFLCNWCNTVAEFDQAMQQAGAAING